MRQPCAWPSVASVIGGESGPCPWVHLPPERVPCPPLKPVTRLRLRLPHAVCSLPQDTVGGRFDATQAFVGELSQFNIWDRVLRAQEIIGIANCSTNMAGTCSAGLPSGPWRPARSVSSTCSCRHLCPGGGREGCPPFPPPPGELSKPPATLGGGGAPKPLPRASLRLRLCGSMCHQLICSQPRLGWFAARRSPEPQVGRFRTSAVGGQGGGDCCP